MRYVLLENFKIANDDANFLIGRVQSTNGRQGPFRVVATVTPDDDCGTIEIATVNSFDECVVTLADYYERNPPRWFRKGAGWYVKETLYSNLRVEQDQEGRWRVYRDGFPLLERRGYPATFFKLEEGQRVADIHLLDSYPNTTPPVDDGYWWLIDQELDWRLQPECVEGRAHWKPLASLWRPNIMPVSV
jgi:hypothetical protein